MSVQNMLARLGLAPHEAMIYLALVENGPGSVSNIAKWTALHRPIVYKFLSPLQAKGLIAPSPRGERTIYIAESPEKLEELIEDTRAQLAQTIPELKKTFLAKGSRVSIKYYEGKNGIRAVFADLVGTLRRGDTFYRYSSARDSREDYLPRNYQTERDRKQLQRFVITNEKRAAGKKSSLDRAVKTIPKEFGLFDHDVTQLIYGNKVAVIDYNNDTAMVIESPTVAEFQKKLFTVLYRKI